MKEGQRQPSRVDRKAVKSYVEGAKSRYKERTGKEPTTEVIVDFGKIAWQRRGFRV